MANCYRAIIHRLKALSALMDFLSILSFIQSPKESCLSTLLELMEWKLQVIIFLLGKLKIPGTNYLLMFSLFRF